ncbi:pentapeptide repeat-containing protein [Nocardia sp. NPDC050799]|uniref:pentapeptide repeat-containing protein n=1 Tax=Nocardia sp. NPDC050799 TaxID=3154842 RepID=UPI0033D5D3A1
MNSKGEHSDVRVRIWPEDARARQTLVEYLDALADQPSRDLTVDILLAADECDFTGADLSGLFLQGAALNEANLRGVRVIEADLYQSWLRYANLDGADLSRSDLRKVQATGCSGVGVVLNGAQLQGASFDDADLRYAFLRGANLHSASFSDANLTGADLRDCNLGSTDFDGCRLANALLSNARGKIFGPVDIGVTKPNPISGPPLESWLADQGAHEVHVYR